MHTTSHPSAGKMVRINKDVKHAQFPNLGGSLCRLEDWWDKLTGSSWMDAKGNPAALVYAIRSGVAGLPTDDEVVYVKHRPHEGLLEFGVILHVSEFVEDDNGHQQ